MLFVPKTPVYTRDFGHIAYFSRQYFSIFDTGIFEYHTFSEPFYTFSDTAYGIQTGGQENARRGDPGGRPHSPYPVPGDRKGRPYAQKFRGCIFKSHPSTFSGIRWDRPGD